MVEAWITNIIAAFATFVYIMVVIKAMEVLVNKNAISSDLSRKVVHIAAGSWIIFWPLFDASHWTMYLNVFVPGIFFLTFLVKGFTAGPEDRDVKTMTRNGDPKELLYGPLMFTVVMLIAGTVYFMTPAGVLMMATVGWGDGIAPYFGKLYGKHKYKTLGREKSLEGSLSFLVFAFIGSFVLWSIIFLEIPTLYTIMVMLIISIVGVIIEALSPRDVDNLLIPLFVVITLYLINPSFL